MAARCRFSIFVRFVLPAAGFGKVTRCARSSDDATTLAQATSAQDDFANRNRTAHGLARGQRRARARRRLRQADASRPVLVLQRRPMVRRCPDASVGSGIQCCQPAAAGGLARHGHAAERAVRHLPRPYAHRSWRRCRRWLRSHRGMPRLLTPSERSGRFSGRGFLGGLDGLFCGWLDGRAGFGVGSRRFRRFRG